MDAQQCDLCPTPSTTCSDPSCPIPEFTPECTNQCLVVACDDPEHESQTCLVTNGEKPCDGTCTTVAACIDCKDLDDILQCCTDYHPYLADSKPYEASPFCWDSAFSDLSCNCDTQPVGPPAPLLASIQALLSDSSIPSSASTSPSLSPFSPQLHASSPFSLPSSLAQPFACMWANCGATFGSLSDLVGHVNLQHLCSIGVHDQPSAPVTQPQAEMHPSCHWGDCAMFPSPSSIPTSSAVASDDDVLNVLTAHLMQDHLGVYPHVPSFPLPTPLPSPQDAFDTGRQLPTTPDPPSHDCSGTHACKWKECTETFASCDDLTTHIASVHIGSGRAHYECFWQGCKRFGNNGFASKQKISRHLQSHTGHRPFQCQVCKQNFSEAATLQQHMRRHTQEKPYVCDFPGCGKAFAITGALTIHKRTHNGLRPFKCKFCDRAFSESSNLSKHLRTHTGARPYACTEDGCQKAFARPDQLARHMNVHRKKGPKG